MTTPAVPANGQSQPRVRPPTHAGGVVVRRDGPALRVTHRLGGQAVGDIVHHRAFELLLPLSLACLLLVPRTVGLLQPLEFSGVLAQVVRTSHEPHLHSGVAGPGSAVYGRRTSGR